MRLNSGQGEAEVKFLQLPEGKLYYEEKGAGKAIVFLHAGLADSRMWQQQWDFFTGKYRMVRCDLRGFGCSPYPDSQFSYEEDVLALVDSLDVEEFVLAGASFGARVAIDFYLSDPELVRGMVLASPVVTGFESSQEVEEFKRQEETLLDQGRLEEATELNLRMWVEGP